MRVCHPVKLHRYEPPPKSSSHVTDKEEKEEVGKEMKFVKSSPAGPDSILKVTGLPYSITLAELFASMFPLGSRLEDMFGGPLTTHDYYRVSSTTALIHLASSDLVSKA